MQKLGLGIVGACICVLGLAATSAAGAGLGQLQRPPYQGGLSLQTRDGGLTLAQAVARAKRQFPGRVVTAKTRQSGDRREHVIRIMSAQGKVRTLVFDAGPSER